MEWVTSCWLPFWDHMTNWILLPFFLLLDSFTNGINESWINESWLTTFGIETFDFTLFIHTTRCQYKTRTTAILGSAANKYWMRWNMSWICFYLALFWSLACPLISIIIFYYIFYYIFYPVQPGTVMLMLSDCNLHSLTDGRASYWIWSTEWQMPPQIEKSCSPWAIIVHHIMDTICKWEDFMRHWRPPISLSVIWCGVILQLQWHKGKRFRDREEKQGNYK